LIEGVEMETYLDVCITRCPSCKTYYAEASWYALELSQNLECGKCGNSFSAEQNSKDRFLLKFFLDEEGKVKSVIRA